MNQKTASLYPYLDDAIEVINKLGVSVSDLEDDKVVLHRAVQRLTESLTSGIVSHGNDSYVELTSFPISVIFVRLIGESYLARRFALAESERAMVTLSKMKKDRLISFAENHLGFTKIKQCDEEFDGQKYPLRVWVLDYIKGAMNLSSDPKWKLVNRILTGGYVYLPKHDLARIMKEHINQMIYDMVSVKLNMKLSPNMNKRYSGFLEYYNDVKPEMTQLGAVNESKFPPCIKEITRKLQASINLNHNERFTFASFLYRVGVDPEDVIQMFNISPDFNEPKTRHQVEQIAGKNGGEGYLPPQCDLMRTYRICYAGENKLCAKAKHPLSYYSMATWVPPQKRLNKGKKN